MKITKKQLINSAVVAASCAGAITAEAAHKKLDIGTDLNQVQSEPFVETSASGGGDVPSTISKVQVFTGPLFAQCTPDFPVPDTGGGGDPSGGGGDPSGGGSGGSGGGGSPSGG